MSQDDFQLLGQRWHYVLQVEEH